MREWRDSHACGDGHCSSCGSGSGTVRGESMEYLLQYNLNCNALVVVWLWAVQGVELCVQLNKLHTTTRYPSSYNV